MLLLNTKTQGENTMDNIQKRRYAKAMQLVDYREDLSLVQKQCYKGYLTSEKDEVGILLDADESVTITLKTKSGKTLITGEGDTDFSSIENRLFHMAMDYVLATPRCIEAEEHESWKKNVFSVGNRYYKIDSWSLSSEIESWNVKINK